MRIFILLLVSIFLVGCSNKPNPPSPPPPNSKSIKISWEANPIEEQIQYYRIYEKVGNTSTLVEQTSDIYKNLNVKFGNHNYYVTAKNVWDKESPPSDIITKNVN